MPKCSTRREALFAASIARDHSEALYTTTADLVYKTNPDQGTRTAVELDDDHPDFNHLDD